MCSGLPSYTGRREYLMLHGDAQQFVEGRVDRHGDDVDAGVMISRVLTFCEVENLLDGLLLEAFQVAFAAARFDDELEFFGRMAPAGVAAAQAKGVRERGGGTLDHEDEGRGNAQEDEQRRRHQQRHAIGFFDGQILRHHLADHHVAEADQQESDRESGAVQPRLRTAG